jgi:hypothetical protein
VKAARAGLCEVTARDPPLLRRGNQREVVMQIVTPARSGRPNLQIVVLSLCALWISGCATVVKGTDESVTLLTEPAGAVCDLEREGETIGAINPTPGTIEVDRDKDDILITCRLEDYEETSNVLSSEFTGYTFGNILLGGVIGVGVDAASGANNDYPDNVTIIMIPKAFASERHRDELYDKLKKQVTDGADALIEKKLGQCRPNFETQCKKRAEKVEEARDAELASLEDKRLRAIITPSPKANSPPLDTAPPS